MTVALAPCSVPTPTERRFELLVSGIRDYAIYMLDTEGHVTSWNSGAHRFKGYLAQEIIGQHFAAFYTEAEQAAGIPANALKTALQDGTYEGEGWRVRKDGTKFWASVVIDPILDDSGVLVGFGKVTRDITERRAAQESLRASEERFRLFVQGVTDYAIYMLSPEGIVTNWNAGAGRIKGYLSAEVIGSSFERFYTLEDQAAGLPALALATAAAEGRYEKEGWRVRKDGTQFWASVVIDAIHADDGQLIGFGKVTHDTSEKRQAAEALERANTALFQSQKMEALGQLTGGIAHDFNNLLGVIMGGLELMRLKAKSLSDVKMFDSMNRAVARGATLTQQLLSFARQQPLKAEDCDLNKVVTEFESVLERAGTAAISFDLDLAPDLHIVHMDAARFEAALLNLVVNSRDAMPDGGNLIISTVNVTVLTGGVGSLNPGEYVKVSVKDSGCGMPPEVVSRVFEPFFTTKDVGKGTGLGLSQVHGFIAQSGGEVVARSEVGKGTTFSMYLPAVLSPQVGERYTSTSERSEPPASKVLIVDDEPDMLEMAAELFQHIGYQVITSTNGQDALETLRRTPDIDLLFTDVVMPNGMSGVELGRVARQLRPKLKVVLASGYPMQALKAQHGSLDEFVLLNKPYRLADLARKLLMVA
jgi:PAS domain S-box-containing protein